MSQLLSKIKERYNAAPARKVNVPEWDTDVYFRPLTTEELDVASANAPKDAGVTRSNLQLVIVKALDSEGKRLFGFDDADELASCSSPNVINRIAAELCSVATVEEAEKN
ncbi:MAG: hypothetical protein HGB35_00035 [Geobacteraceae bacterium]|nr:hypothetical protein [Geobacteraceae bacterium]